MARERIPGIASEAEVALQGIVKGLSDRLDLLEKGPTAPAVITANFTAREGQFLRVAAPASGLVILLPKAQTANRNARITFAFETPHPVTIRCIGGSVNRESQVVSTVLGTFEAICDGQNGWAVGQGISSSGSPTDAHYIVGAAHGSLPNGSVGQDTTHINFVYTPGGFATWTWLGVAVQDDNAAQGLATTLDFTSTTSILAAAPVAGSESVVSFQRAALTGDITAAQNVNTTAFRVFDAKSVLVNATNGSAVPDDLAAATARHVLRANNANSALEWGYPVKLLQGGEIDKGDFYSLNFSGGTNTEATVTDDGLGAATIQFSVDDYPLTGLADQADDTFLANISGAAAPPTAVALSTLAGAGLTGGANAVLAVGAGSGITVNANDVQLTTIADDTFMANVSGGAAVATGKTFSSLAGLSLTYNTTSHALDFDGTPILENGAGAHSGATSINFVAGTGVTVDVTDAGGGQANVTVAASGGSSVPFPGELEVTTTGAITDQARTGDAHAITFSGAAPVVNGIATFSTKGETILVGKQDAGTLDLVDNTGATNNRLAIYQDKTLRLRDDEYAMFVGVDLSSGGTDSPRWACVSHRPPFANCADNIRGHQIQHNGTDWVAQDYIELGTADTSAIAGGGDIRKGSNLLINSGNIMELNTVIGNLTVDAGAQLHLIGGSFINISGNTGVNITANGVGNLPHLFIEETATTPATVAGRGVYWVQNTTPSRAMFTDDVGEDWALNVHGVASNTAIQSITNSTSLVTGTSFTIPANTLRAGSTYQVVAQGVFTRGATATANAVRGIIIVNGTELTATVVAGTVANGYGFEIRGTFTQLTTGGAGTCTYNVGLNLTTPAAGTGEFTGSAQSGTVANNTTTSTTLAVGSRMSAAVANCTVAITNAYIMRVL